MKIRMRQNPGAIICTNAGLSIVNRTLGKEFHSNFNWNSNVFIQGNEFEKIVWKNGGFFSASMCLAGSFDMNGDWLSHYISYVM